MSQDLLRIYLTNKYVLGVELSPIVWAIVVALLLVLVASHFLRRGKKPYQVIQLNIQLGNIGSVQMKPNWEDIQVAHKIWTELVTRKAAIPIDPDNDVISEIYASWYTLFQKIRQLVSDIPSQCIRKEKSTQELVRIAVETLNLGLRPHLTKWQARYRNWWFQTESELKTKSPQQHQKEFPQFSELLGDMLLVNHQLIQYAGELQKIVQAK
jgi:hypothetical protein